MLGAALITYEFLLTCDKEIGILVRRDRKTRPLPVIMVIAIRLCLFGFLISAGISDNSVRCVSILLPVPILYLVFRGTPDIRANASGHEYSDLFAIHECQWYDCVDDQCYPRPGYHDVDLWYPRRLGPNCALTL